MKSKTTILLAMLLCTLFAFSGAQAQDTQSKLEDLNAFCAGIKAEHANPFSHISEAEFDALSDGIAAQLDGMSNAQFYYALRGLAASIGDAHTTVGFSVSPYAYLRALPFAVVPAQNRWYAAILPSEHTDKLGWEVASIDGIPMEDVFQRALAIISFENEGWAAQQFSNTINFLDALQFLDIAPEDADGVTLSLVQPEGAEKCELFVPALSESEIMQASLARLTPEAPALTAASGYYRAFALNEDAFFIQYNVCQEAPDMSMAQFAEAIDGLLNKGTYGKLLLDLRYNTGGDSSVIGLLLDMLKNHALDCYALIGPNTFSSAVMNALDAQAQLGAVLVGQPTGGSVNAFGELQAFALPHMPLTLYVSTKYFELVTGYGDGPLTPDYAVEDSLEDTLAGRDAVVEFVLSL